MKNKYNFEIIHNYEKNGERMCDSVACFETDWETALFLFYSVCDSYGIDSDEVSVDEKKYRAFGELYEEKESVMLVVEKNK